MRLRELLLRVMLWSLGFSAAAGVCAVLLAGHDVIWRVAGTGTAGAIASALLLASSRWVDRDNTRPAGLLAMSVVIVEFLLALVLIWGVLPWAASFVNEERVGLTATAVALAGPPAVLALFLARLAGGAPAGRTALSLCGACFSMMLVGAWWPGSHLIQDHFWSTAGFVGGWGLPAVAALAGTPLVRRPWRWLALAAAVVGAAMAAADVWFELRPRDDVLACVAGLAVVIGYWNLALLVPLTASQRWVRFVAMAAILVTATLLDVRAVTHRQLSAGTLERAAGAAEIVAACSGLALLVLGRLNRRLQPAAAANLNALVLICPRCRKQQTMPVGGASCIGCGLRIDVRLTEPRCANCGYLLYGLRSDRCPECGTPLSRATTAEQAMTRHAAALSMGAD